MAILEILNQEWAIRALIASIMVGVMCGILGCFIVLRNMSLIGDALSHAVLPGVVIAFVLVGYSAFGFFVGSVVAGLLSAIAITWIQQNVRTKNDAAIGIVFTAMFSIGVMGISWLSHKQGVHLDLKDFLFGNVLGVGDQDLWLTAAVTLTVVSSVIIFYRYLFVTTFQSVIAKTMGINVQMVHYLLMLMLSFAVVASLQTVGVILVVAMLITPASTALLLSDRLQKVLIIAALIGASTAVLGFFVAVVMDTTPGPAMTVLATLFYLIAVLFSPRKGLFFKYLRKRKLKVRIQMEDILKQSLKLYENNNLSFDNLKNNIGFDLNILKNHLKTLENGGFIHQKNGNLMLTTEGVSIATRLVRAHRLWESYLATNVGLTGEQVHDDAEHFEHILTDDLLDEIDEKLGFPELDPHGEPIPKK
jgi:ABC-type Mn2+/Zn2+ transport system permease subunit/Mn-dependent DtxR family transcriptional regulator